LPSICEGIFYVGGKKMKKYLSMILVVLMVFVFTGCGADNTVAEDVTTPTDTVVDSTEASEDTQADDTAAETVEPNGEIILSTTTSTENSGLLAYILPDFTAKTGIEVKVVAVGTGAALQMGRDGEADVLLVHAKPDELTFVEEGHGTYRKDVMYNDFVIVGPESDPLDIQSKNITDAFNSLTSGEAKFVSRGDNSGTNKKELTLWNNVEVDPSGNDWYVASGQGMGDTLTMTSELMGYTLTDRATYLAMKDNLDLIIVLEGDDSLFNQYGVIPVNPDKNEQINNEGAEAFVEWINSAEVQEMILGFGIEEYGQSLFYPNAE